MAEHEEPNPPQHPPKRIPNKYVGPDEPPVPEARLKPTARQPVMAQPSSIKEMDATHLSWVCIAHFDHTAEDVKHPSYLWRHARISAGDKVEIRHDGGDYLIELLILKRDTECQGLTARVLRELHLPKHELIAPSMDGAFVAQAGDQWAVRMGHVVLKDGFKTEHQAGRWLMDKTESLLRRD